MRTYPTLILADMKEITDISIATIQKLLDQLIPKKHVERREKDGSCRVFVTQFEILFSSSKQQDLRGDASQIA